MPLSPAFLDELRARTSLAALIGRSLKLQRAGWEWKACCPFHSEKTASFFVVEEKGFYHCHGCTAHGDAIDWLVETRGLTFVDAVKGLAEAAGLEMPSPDPRAQERDRRAASLREVMERAAAWYQAQLAGIGGAAARTYLSGRGFSDETVQRFGLGFAPGGRNTLREALPEFDTAALVAAGLLIQPEGREPYDRFRNRLMIPIRDARGRVVAFSARSLDGSEPKYLNSPETQLFDKGRTLFNLDRAAAASRSSGRVIAVEGCLDVIALDQAGLAESVAPLGTAITEAQLGLLWRIAATPILCLDGDAAGRTAATRTAVRALPHVAPGRSLAFAALPTPHDPDSLIRERGRRALEALLERTQPLADLLWQHELRAAPIATPEEKAGLRKRLMDLAASVADPLTRAEYRRTFGDNLADLWRPRRDRVDSRFGRNRDRRPLARPNDSGGDLDGTLRRSILIGLARFPDVVAGNAEAVSALRFVGAERQLADRLLERAYSEPGSGGPDEQAASLLEEVRRGGPILRFSFLRADTDPAVAAAQLAEALTIAGGARG